MSASTKTTTRYAAVVDVENIAMVAGRRLPADRLQHLLHRIAASTVGMPVRAATGVNLFRPYTGTLAGHRWGLTLVDATPEAADLALLQAAQDFIGRGVTDLIVASGDHAFAVLAHQVRLHVVTHADHLSRKLRLAATTVTYLPETGPASRAAA